MATTDITQKDLQRTHGAKLEELARLLGLSLDWSTRDNRDYYPATLRGGRLEPDYYLEQRKHYRHLAIHTSYLKLYRAAGRNPYDANRPAAPSIGISLTRTTKTLAADITRRLITPARAEYNRLAKLIAQADAAETMELAQLTQLLAPLDYAPTVADVRTGRDIRLARYGLIRTSAHELTAPYRDSAARLEIEVRNPYALAQIIKILAADARAATEAAAV